MKGACPAGASFVPDAKCCRCRFGRVIFALLASILLPALPAGAQNTSQRAFSVHVETQLVQVRVRVVGRDGKPVSGLKKTDFAVKVNGHRQPVATLDYVPVPSLVEKATTKPESVAVPQSRSVRPTRRHVWIYIDTEVDSGEVGLAYQAIKKFLSTQLQPGFMVSMDGLPFTDDRTQLLATLEKMRRGPFGHLPDVPPLINSTLDMEKQADYEWLLYSALLGGTRGATPPPGFARLSMRQGIEPGGGGAFSTQTDELKQDLSVTEQEMSLYVRSALFRYLDIIYRLEALEGEKAIVIFRSGLRMDPDNMTLLHRFAADAMRHRVVFYTVDTRGLYTIDPAANREELLRYGVAIPAWAVSSSTAFLRALNDYGRTDDVVRGREDGLDDVARLTGGKAITNTNDLNTVFNAVEEDSNGYYIVGFYPTDKRQLGRFRRVKVAVDVPHAKVNSPKGYYEPLPFKELSKREKDVVLWQAMRSEMPRDFPVAASVNVFRGENGQPVAVVSTGVRLGSLAAKRKKGASEVHVTELAEIGAAAGGTPPLYHGQVASVSVANSVYSKASAIPSEFVTFNTRILVSPGKHIFKVVFRDDHAGKLGAEELKFDAPDYSQGPASSTLLVTRHATPIPAGAAAGNGSQKATPVAGGLQAGPMDFKPQPNAAFYAGDRIYLLYELYDPPSYDFNVLAASAHTVLSRNGVPIHRFNIKWRILPDAQRKLVVLIGTLDTTHYRAGTYQVVQTVPVIAPARHKLLASFTLLPKNQ